MSRGGARAKRSGRGAQSVPGVPSPGPVAARGLPSDLVGLATVAVDRFATPLDRLSAARAARDALDLAEAEAWVDVRESGFSWAEVAERLRIGRSGAQMRCAALRERFGI